MLCDIILLNFLKGAEHYKARKFEEVSHGAGAAVGPGPRRGAGTTLGGGLHRAPHGDV